MNDGRLTGATIGMGIVAFVLLAIVAIADHGHKNALAAQARTDAVFNSRLQDSVVALLRPGEVIVRMSPGADSYILSRLNEHDRRYSHCGMVFIENNYPFVYHCIGGEDNPGMRMRRDSAIQFIAPVRCLRLAVVKYDFDSVVCQKLADVVHTIYGKRPKFDINFDLSTDSALYCSEFVYKAIRAATGDSAFIPLSAIKGQKYVGIDDLYLNPHATVVRVAKYR